MANTTYATIVELKQRVSIAPDDSGADALLQNMLDAVAFLTDRYVAVGRFESEQFSASDPQVRQFYREDDANSAVSIDDAVEILAVSIGDVTLDPADWYVWPGTPIQAIWVRAIPAACNYSERHWLKVAARWGYCEAADRPAVVKEAVLRQAAIMLARSGGAGPNANGDEGLDPAVAAMLAPLLRRPYIV